VLQAVMTVREKRGAGHPASRDANAPKWPANEVTARLGGQPMRDEEMLAEIEGLPRRLQPAEACGSMGSGWQPGHLG
jgi:hypothetical protein